LDTTKRIGRPPKNAAVEFAQIGGDEVRVSVEGITVHLPVEALIWVEDQVNVLGMTVAEVVTAAVLDAMGQKASDPVPAFKPVSREDVLKAFAKTELSEDAEEILNEMLKRLQNFTQNAYHNKFCRDFYNVLLCFENGEGVPIKPEW
jgi:hypothetical protein